MNYLFYFNLNVLCLLNQVCRPILCLIKNPSNIFTKYADAYQLYSSHEKHYGHDGGIAGNGVAPYYYFGYYPQHVTQCPDSYYDSDEGGYSEWGSGEARNALDGKIEK